MRFWEQEIFNGLPGASSRNWFFEADIGKLSAKLILKVPGNSRKS